MDTKEAGRQGGLKRFSNLTPEQVRERNSAAGKALWAGMSTSERAAHVKKTRDARWPKKRK